MSRPSYEQIAAEIGRLVEEKNRAYGSSFEKSGAILRILYPDGIPVEKLDDALTVVRVLDKVFRIATDRDALGESPWRDIAGYALLSVARVEAAKAAPKEAKRHLCDARLSLCPECEPLSCVRPAHSAGVHVASTGETW